MFRVEYSNCWNSLFNWPINRIWNKRRAVYLFTIIGNRVCNLLSFITLPKILTWWLRYAELSISAFVTARVANSSTYNGDENRRNEHCRVWTLELWCVEICNLKEYTDHNQTSRRILLMKTFLCLLSIPWIINRIQYKNMVMICLHSFLNWQKLFQYFWFMFHQKKLGTKRNFT